MAILRSQSLPIKKMEQIKKQKTSMFLPQRHGDKGPYTIIAALKRVRIRRIVSQIGDAENVRENAPLGLNPINCNTP